MGKYLEILDSCGMVFFLQWFVGVSRFLFKQESCSVEDLSDFQVLWAEFFAFSASFASFCLAFGRDVFPVFAFYFIVLVGYIIFIIQREYFGNVDSFWAGRTISASGASHEADLRVSFLDLSDYS